MPRSTLMEALISLQHIFRIAKAVNVDPSTAFEKGVVYIVDQKDRQIVADTWTNAFKDAPDLLIVLVEGLPRGAKVEWHIIRSQKTSVDLKNSKMRTALNECEVFTAIHELEGEYGVLCITFGSRKWPDPNKLQHLNVAVQRIPSKAVYLLSNKTIEGHNSCSILLSA